MILPAKCSSVDFHGKQQKVKLFKIEIVWIRVKYFSESLKEYFGQFGVVAEAMVMRDPTTKHSRGFGFVTFTDTESVEKVMQYGIHNLDGKKIDPKVAFPKESTPKVGAIVKMFESFNV